MLGYIKRYSPITFNHFLKNKIAFSLAMYLLLFLFETVFHVVSLGWSGTSPVTEGDLELLTLVLAPSPKYWEDKHSV